MSTSISSHCLFGSGAWVELNCIVCPTSVVIEVKVLPGVPSHLGARLWEKCALNSSQSLAGSISLQWWDCGPVAVMTCGWGPLWAPGRCLVPPCVARFSNRSQKSFSLKTGSSILISSLLRQNFMWHHIISAVTLLNLSRVVLIRSARAHTHTHTHTGTHGRWWHQTGCDSVRPTLCHV